MPEREERWSSVSTEWNGLGEQFAALGRALRSQYEEDRDDENAKASAREVKDAFERAMASFADAIDAGADAIRAPEVKDSARESAKALGQAITRTLDAVAEEVNEAVRSRKSGDGPAASGN